MKRTLPYGLAAFLVAVALPSACSCGSKCRGVTCPQSTVCNAATGACECGAVNGGVGTTVLVCNTGESCDPNLRSCVSALCDHRDGGACTNGLSCDPADGLCKCGAVACSPGQLCDPLTHACLTNPLCAGLLCPGGESCNPKTGACVCGAATCAAAQTCVDGGCLADPCAGVTCSGANNFCFAGLCHCGTSAGPTCNEEQFCDGTACREDSICAAVTCEPGTVCGANDGLCHCGGTAGPTCRGNSTCVLYLPDSGLPLPSDAGLVPGTPGLFGRCLGGDLCAGVACSPGEVCDPVTGTCLCGTLDAGTKAVRCTQAQFCGQDQSGEVTCLTECNPYGAPCAPLLIRTDAGTTTVVPEACFYEPALGQLLCEAAGTGSEGDACTNQTACLTGSTCAQPPDALADAGAVVSCRQFCNTFDGGPLGCNTQDRQCFPVILIVSDGGNVAVGTCWPPLPQDGGGA